MFEFRTVSYRSSAYESMLLLRESLLRHPLGLIFSETDLKEEVNDLFLGCFQKENHILTGCCILRRVDEDMVQLRQMAVKESFQGQGIGRRLLLFAEKKALKAGFSTVMMHARMPAVPFYERLGYSKKGAPFEEVTLLHCEMTKFFKKQ